MDNIKLLKFWKEIRTKAKGQYQVTLNFERKRRLKDEEGILTDQEFLNFGIFSSFKESAIEDFEATAQPLHMEVAQIKWTI